MSQSAPSRKDYIKQQKAKGRRLVGAFPAQYPRELFWAAGAAPLEIWDPPLEVSSAGAHLQAYICPVVQQGLELILGGHCDELDAFIFPHTCDSIQNMASVVHDYLGLDKPCYFFYHPKEPYTAASRAYYIAQLKALARRMEPVLGPVADDALAEAVALGARAWALIRELYDLRAAGRLACSARRFYDVVRLNEYLHPEDLIPILEAFKDEAQGQATAGPAVVLSGVLPDPPEILGVLDDAGARLAADDLLSMSRRLIMDPPASADPWEALADQYFSLPPCSSKNSSIDRRLAWLDDLVQSTGAKGVIFNLVKFCEPELFDAPQLVEALKERGLATLVMDTELGSLSGQMATRVEALVEMME